MSNIEEHIRRAMEEGKFNNLPGKGKPLRWDVNPNEDPDWRLANHILHGSGFTLPWIETLRDLETAIESARQELRRAWSWRQAALAESQSSQYIETEWQRSLQAFRAKIQTLNQRIRDYNLTAPAARFQLRLLNYTREVEHD
jgi:DnaJ family protein C protein 28